MTNKIVTILTHTQYKDGIPIYGPPDNIIDYLRSYYEGDVLYLQHSLYKGDGSVLNLYRNGKIEKIYQYNFHKDWPAILRYIVDLFFSIKLLIKFIKVSVIIAVDPLNFFYAFLLKKIGGVEKIIFYTMDYGYKRFNNPFLNTIYHFFDRFAASRCDESWSACRKIADIRRKQNVPESKNIYIPNSPILHDIAIKPLDEIDRFSLVCLFSNYLQVDFKVIFDAMEILYNKFPKIKLKLIGRGNFREAVEHLMNNKEILNNIEFLDIYSHADALCEISKCAIGLECNTQTLAWNEFREPIKIREYIAFGLPIISKPGHALVEDIEKDEIGFIVTNADEFVKAVESFLNNFTYYTQVREKVLRLGKLYDKKRILDSVFLRNMGNDILLERK